MTIKRTKMDEEFLNMLKKKTAVSSVDRLAASATVKKNKEQVDAAIKEGKTVYVLDGKRESKILEGASTFLPLVGVLGRKVSVGLVEDMIIKIAQLGKMEANEKGAHFCRNKENELDLSTKVCEGTNCGVAIRDCHGKDEVGTVHYHPGGNSTPTVADGYNSLRGALDRLEDADTDDEFLGMLDCNLTYTPVPEGYEKSGNIAMLTCIAPNLSSLPQRDDPSRDKAIEKLIAEMARTQVVTAQKLTDGLINSAAPIYGFEPLLKVLDIYEIPLPTFAAIEALDNFKADEKEYYAFDNPFSPWRVFLAAFAPERKDRMMNDLQYFSDASLKHYQVLADASFRDALDYHENEESPINGIVDIMDSYIRTMNQRAHDQISDFQRGVLAERVDRLEQAKNDLMFAAKTSLSEGNRIAQVWSGVVDPCSNQSADYLNYIQGLLQEVVSQSQVATSLVSSLGEKSFAKEMRDLGYKLYEAGYPIRAARQAISRYCKTDVSKGITNMNNFPAEQLTDGNVPAGEIIVRH